MSEYKIEKFDNMQLKLFAMACMLCDHIGAVFFPGVIWLRIIGRLAFPIFAFELAEGFVLTRDRGKYILRMFLFGILAEYPFQTVIRRRGFSVGMTNVLFSFFVCLAVLVMIDEAEKRFHGWMRTVCYVLAVMFGILFSTQLNCDYAGTCVLTVVMFYFTRNMDGLRKYFWQAVVMLFVNWVMMGADLIPGTHMPLQGVAILALLPIWCYNHQRGFGGKKLRAACYAFYPAHLWVLFLVKLLLH